MKARIILTFDVPLELPPEASPEEVEQARQTWLAKAQEGPCRLAAQLPTTIERIRANVAIVA